MAWVSLRHVSKRFGTVVAVDDLQLELQDGEFTILLGPSGCGKTTSLLMVAGLETTSGGHILFDEQSVEHLPPHKRDIAMVFQSYALYPHMSVYDNMAFGLKMRRVPRAEIERRVKEAAELLRIGELLGRYPRQLSGGQRQRVALGRAIVRRPKAFLLDEPLSNVDAKLRAQMRLELRALQQDLKATFIYVTHDQLEAMSMGDRIAIMDRGRLQQVAPPPEIYDQPVNAFVATFIGSPAMNLYGGRLRLEGGVPRFESDGLQYALPPTAAPHAGDDLSLGVRPEDVLLTPVDGDADGLRGQVRIVEHLGADRYVLLLFGSQQLIARASPDFAVHPGDRVGVRFRPGKVHLFRGAQGERLATV
jgi:ABC-type sugar transport system ATPase subunit